MSQDAERLARFEREAKLLACLNHPNIAAIHSVHEADGMRSLAMDLVPGEFLHVSYAEYIYSGTDSRLIIIIRIRDADVPFCDSSGLSPTPYSPRGRESGPPPAAEGVPKEAWSGWRDTP